jgi:16S rRNA (guanine527-N7)-methyltransferase
MKQNQIQRMGRLFSEAGLIMTDSQVERFIRFYDMLMEHNEAFDLTRLKNLDDIIIKHFIDSVYFTRFVTLPPSIVDIGTGPGFPGIPLKIMNPGLRLILAEPRQRRVTFLGMAVDELDLTDTEIYPHLVTEKSFSRWTVSSPGHWSRRTAHCPA